MQVHRSEEHEGVARRATHNRKRVADMLLNKQFWIGLLLWSIGLFFAFGFQGITLTTEQQLAYEVAMSRVQGERLQMLQAATLAAEGQHEASKRWLFFCDSHCRDLRRELEDKRRQLEQLESETEQHVKDARKAVGVFSSLAVAEARQLFIQQLYNGRNLAARSALMGAMLQFGVVSPFGWLGLIFQGLGQAVGNTVIGTAYACASFVFKLFWLLVSYDAHVVEMVLFYSLGLFSVCAVAIAVAVALVGALMLCMVAVGGAFRVGLSAAKLLASAQHGRGAGQSLHED